MELKIEVLNAMRLTKLLIAASRWLSRHADVLNDLNVYPVPDGDTGTNMSMTLQAVENQLVKLNYEPKMAELCEIVSESILLGARGNSGTILSQIIQGFLMGIQEKEEATVEDVIRAFGQAKEKAYKAVSNPVEGTILTVIRKVAEAAENYEGDKKDFIPFLIYLKNISAEAVEETPTLLPKLKEAGVVDAGGKGIFYILEGFEKSITDPQMLEDLERIIQSQSKRREMLDSTAMEMEDIKFKYCTEFIIENGSFNLEEYKEKISQYGDSIVCAQTSKKTKTHIHTNNPGIILEIACALGSLSNMKIENMEIQHHNNKLFKEEDYTLVQQNILIRNENARPVGYFAIADTKEMGEIFLNIGAAGVLIGGQTNNPSVADIEEGIKKLDAQKIIVLPNNKNIISAAKIAAERSNKEVTVLETKSMLEGHYLIKNKDLKIESVIEHLSVNTSIEITKAVRDTRVDNLEIIKGNYIAIVNGKIKETNSSLQNLILTLKSKYLTENTLNVLVSLGKNVDEEMTVELKDVPQGIRYEEINCKQENYYYYIYIENRDPKLPEIAIVTDSTSDLSEEMIREYPNLEIIPLKVKLDGDNYYRDGVDISKQEFWKKIVEGGQLPKTSQPSPAEFKSLYEKLFAKGYKKIISIHISGKLSGTQQAARVARGMLNREEDVVILDSKTVTFALGHLAIEASKMAMEKKSLKEIIDWLEESKELMKVYFVVKDLDYLQRGGRIGRASALIGGIFRVKPVLKVENGEVSVEAKVLGEKGALLHMEKIIKSAKTSIILYTGWGGNQSCLSSADSLKTIAERFKKVDYRGRVEIGAVIGSHAGPVYGIGIMDKIR
ncbi:DegV family EDD domain-containing protein [Fusobacterium perfoetens]|uniref:DegV family EDD domain-containing protein n=1 Tax=Fusobacterium perfoetens TaxID=852 RepID=UPI000488CFCA|nr:DegV family EDD domain-containing protein [Fusobacterium perfoetens]MCI6153367.1 DegV family EDD domain-containing protein [Fusobacterium perfoetens]MDY3236518.1 DegV family EDD domain-containing protein [Fusobacterium perfoetens]